jgi:predicted NBD/HSP70 family sugar kinase/DNA-binding transcriptional ArsR family regulator
MSERSRRRILDLLRQHGPTSQAEVARRTELSPATVSLLVRELEGRGAVVVGGQVRPARGRPSAVVALAPGAANAAAVVLGHHVMRVAVGDLELELAPVGRPGLPRTVSTPNGLPTMPAPLINADPAATLDQAADAVQGVLRAAGVDPSRVVGVGLGLPAPIDRRGRTVASSRLFPAWAGRRPADELERRLGLPVELHNDADLGAVGETLKGAAAGRSDVLYIKAATGIGAGLVLGGRLFRGTRGVAGEIGHVVVDEMAEDASSTVRKLRVCQCGNVGCLERFAGAEAISAAVRAETGEDLNLDTIVARAREGSGPHRRALAEAGRSIGLVLANVWNLLDPECAVLGGRLSEAGDLVLEPMRDAVRRRLVQDLAAPEVLAGALGRKAEVQGAMAQVFRSQDPRIAARFHRALDEYRPGLEVAQA